jgi:hypothetical protein
MRNDDGREGEGLMKWCVTESALGCELYGSNVGVVIYDEGLDIVVMSVMGSLGDVYWVMGSSGGEMTEIKSSK